MLPGFYMLNRKDQVIQVQPEISSKFREKSGLMRLKSTHYDEQFKEEFLEKKPSLNQSSDAWTEFRQFGEAQGIGEPV